MKKSFLLYAEYEQYFDMLNPYEQAKLLKALFTTFKGENVDDLSLNMNDATKMAFAFMSNQLKIDEDKYQQKCEINRKNGAKGGAPKGNKNAVKNKQMINENENYSIDESLSNNESLSSNESLSNNNNLSIKKNETNNNYNLNINDNYNQQIVDNYNQQIYDNNNQIVDNYNINNNNYSTNDNELIDITTNTLINNNNDNQNEYKSSFNYSTQNDNTTNYNLSNKKDNIFNEENNITNKYYITKKEYLTAKDNLTKKDCRKSTLNENKNNRTVIFLTQNNPKQQDIDKEKDNDIDKDKDKVKDSYYSLVNKKNKNIIDYIINNARAREKEITLLKEKFSYKNIYEKLKPAYLLTLEVMNLLKSNLSQFNEHIRYAKQVYKVSELQKYLDNISINDLIDIAQTTTYNSQIINKKAYILGAILCKSTSGATKNFDKTITNEVKNITSNEFNNATANEFEKITMQEVINNTANECTSTNKNKIINSNLNDYEELYEKLKVIYGCK